METTRKQRFRQIFENHYPVLCRIARGYVSDPDDCEDIVQELFVSVWNKEKDLLPEAELAAYLTTAVRNNCISILRRRQRVETVSVDLRPVELSCAPADDDAPTDYSALLDAILATLPAKCRDVFMMSKFQHMKYKDIALALDISEKTVENHIGKAYKMIRAYVATHPIAMLALTFFHLTIKDL